MIRLETTHSNQMYSLDWFFFEIRFRKNNKLTPLTLKDRDWYAMSNQTPLL